MEARQVRNRLEMAGVVLEGPPWTVDGEPMDTARSAVETFFARCHPSTQDLPEAVTWYIRRMSGWQLACAGAMVRRARAESGMTITELAKASGISRRTIRRIEQAESGALCTTAFHLLHACYR